MDWADWRSAARPSSEHGPEQRFRQDLRLPARAPSDTTRRHKEENAMQSRATAHWEGDLMSGKGKASAASGTFKDANLGWKARTEGAAGYTTPEELLAAAHASCFSMALSHG